MTREQKIYDEIKCRYIQRYGRRGWFYKDYFENEESGFPYFTESLQDNEPWLSGSNNTINDDIDTIWDNIRDGIFNSARITHMVDQLTDKYHKD